MADLADYQTEPLRVRATWNHDGIAHASRYDVRVILIEAFDAVIEFNGEMTSFVEGALFQDDIVLCSPHRVPRLL